MSFLDCPLDDECQTAFWDSVSQFNTDSGGNSSISICLQPFAPATYLGIESCDPGYYCASRETPSCRTWAFLLCV
jgi:hypothetical protein